MCPTLQITGFFYYLLDGFAETWICAYPITVVCSGRILYTTRTSPGCE
jgi:hypothetical protein